VSWETTVDFPERTRANGFVPRLWATQRVGWLAAEKRANGGSAEIDNEIRALGERYGIPTEFTSYFVPEPGVMAQLGGNRILPAADAGGRVARAAAPPTEAEARRQRFEEARVSAGQRDAVSLQAVTVVVDSAIATSGGQIRQASNRTFVMRDGVWTDGVDVPNATIVRVQAYSPAYFAVVERLPLVAEAFSLGERVRIAGRNVILEVSPDGAEQLSDAELRRIVASW
jgi:Ca-activated chloride channel family protein